jgi:cell division septation protein DedD
MSRIDYITIGIVSVCILAIGFLLYKMTDLFGPQGASAPVETSQNAVEIEEEGDIYDYETDRPLDTTDAEPVASDTFSAPASKVAIQPPVASKPKPTTPKPSTSQQTEVETAPREAESEISQEPASAAQGAYMVFAGTFKQKINAEKRLSQLRKSGYEEASIEIFDRGRYAVVIAGRFDNMQAAEDLKEKLKGDGFSAVVRVKEE